MSVSWVSPCSTYLTWNWATMSKKSERNSDTYLKQVAYNFTVFKHTDCITVYNIPCSLTSTTKYFSRCCWPYSVVNMVSFHSTGFLSSKCCTAILLTVWNNNNLSGIKISLYFNFALMVDFMYRCDHSYNSFGVHPTYKDHNKAQFLPVPVVHPSLTQE